MPLDDVTDACLVDTEDARLRRVGVGDGIEEEIVTRARLAFGGMAATTWYAAWIQKGLSLLAGNANNAGIIALKNADGTWSPPAVAPPLAATALWNVWPASSKDIWFVGNNGAVERFDGTTNWTVVPFPTLPQQPAILAIWGSTDDGLDVWVSTDRGGLWRYAGQ